MDLHYSVPRDAYIRLLADMIRKNEHRPVRLFTAFLMTFGQMAVVLLLCIFKLEGSQRVFFLVWSLLLAGITILRRRTRKQRAKGTLERLEYSGQLPQDYWKEHHLRLRGDELLLTYGGARLTCPLRGITSVKEQDGDLFLYADTAIFDIVPAGAFATAAAKDRFASLLRGRSESARSVFAGTGSGALASEQTGCQWELDPAAFAEGQYLAYRQLYYRYRFLRPATFLRLAVSAAAVVSMMHERTPLALALGFAVLLTANLENISMLPLLCRLRIRKELGTWQNSRSFSLTLQEDTLLFASNTSEISIPLHQINLCEKLGPFHAIAWKRFPAVVFPAELAEQPAFRSILEQIPSISR